MNILLQELLSTHDSSRYEKLCQLRIEANDLIRPLALEWLHQCREQICRAEQKMDELTIGVLNEIPVPMLSPADQRALDEHHAAMRALVAAVDSHPFGSIAFVEILEHHLCCDHSEESMPTLVLTPEFDNVVQTGKHAFERYYMQVSPEGGAL